jgi:hypothetical protein
MKFVVYYESFYIYDEIVIDYNILRYHKKSIQYDGHFNKNSTPAWKKYFPYSAANTDAVGQEIPPRVLTPKGTSRAHNHWSSHNDLSSLLWIHPSDTP